MLKKHKGQFLATLLLLAIIPVFNVHAESVTVHDQAELKQALENESVTTIILGENINTTEKINVLRNVTIDGNGHTMKYVGTFGASGSSENTTWGGIYVLQVYKATATIKNIKLTGGNGGLLVNGGHVTFEGTIDVSGNGFGGIELGQGAAVESVAHLTIADGAKIVNTTETADRPTLWVPEDSTGAILEMNGVKQTLNAGDEFTIQEINNLFAEQDNVNTADPLVWYITLAFLGLLTFGYSAKKLVVQR